MKNALRNILLNPIGLPLAVVHWVIVFFAFVYLPKDNFNHVPTIGSLAFLAFFMLIAIDLLAIIPAAILAFPVYLLGKSSETYVISAACISFFTITFQWLFFGQKLYNQFWLKKTEFTNLGIANESDE